MRALSALGLVAAIALITGNAEAMPPASAEDVGRIAERIAFQQDSAELKPSTSPLLDAVAATLKQQPELFPLVALEGHAADNERTPMRLSLARSSAVRVALLARGVDGARLLARASGSTAPGCFQQTDACRAAERTVEFITLPIPKPAPPPPPPEIAAPAETPPPAKKPAAEPSAPLDRIEFNKGSAVIAPSALGNLDLLAGFMKANDVSVEIVGYADDRERRAGLAAARAEAVRKYMMACGVSGQHLTTRTEQTGRATCRSHSANCAARAGRAELRFAEPE